MKELQKKAEHKAPAAHKEPAPKKTAPAKAPGTKPAPVRKAIVKPTLADHVAGVLDNLEANGLLADHGRNVAYDLISQDIDSNRLDYKRHDLTNKELKNLLGIK